MLARLFLLALQRNSRKTERGAIKLFCRVVARAAFFALLAAAALAQPPALFEEVGDITATLSQITGWKVRTQVPSEMLGKDNFRRMVESSAKKAAHDKEVHAEEVTLKMFGFVPRDFNLTQESVDIVSEQAAAFYDYNKKRLYILDSTPEGIEQRVALAHELAHALADQHHRLGKYLDAAPDDDATLARQAVMDGQAQWLSWAYVSQINGGKAELSATLLNELTGAVGADGPVFSTAPLWVRESLVFPYNEGIRFQDAVFHKLGREGFDAVFTRAPVSTQQILHPDAYLAGLKPEEPDPPLLAPLVGKNAGRFRSLTEGSLGEFDLSVLLRQYIDPTEAVQAASHWRGGSYRLYEHKGEKYSVLAFTSVWDSPQSAHTFFELYQRVMKDKWKKIAVSARSADEVSGAGDDGRFQLRVSGTAVQSIEGLR
jgi:hypothetical protein